MSEIKIAEIRGALLFCQDCTNLLPQSSGTTENILKCDCCGQEHRDAVSDPQETETKGSDFPSRLRQKLSIYQTVERHKISTERTDPNTNCPKCGVTDIRYSEVQARGADEGSTILYNCDCGHKWSINN
ncbi:hypothetical protein QBC37DRAFT_33278 [Rhypophila decipiens]|uniref:DNA-directed RNA polymerase subunit n=1 Tax=Rhypophila decipiens TaxID=261697 RepID=A0AAN6YEF7_9PEZI|nr:hypothetical protein QBC37DRAFT_33278 [Rhypophila decipiens]